MISRETFIAMVDAVQHQEKLDRRIGKAVDVFSEGDSDGLNNNSFVFVTPLSSSVVRLLEVELCDQDQTVSWWLWDAPDAGKDINGSKVTRDGKDFVIGDAGDLYDWMRFGWTSRALEGTK